MMARAAFIKHYLSATFICLDLTAMIHAVRGQNKFVFSGLENPALICHLCGSMAVIELSNPNILNTVTPVLMNKCCTLVNV